MKTKSLIVAVMVVMAVMAVFVQTSIAADSVLDAEITSMAVATDKNGNEYVRFIIQEDKNLNGIKYKADTVVMCFGTVVEKAKAFGTGERLKAIVASNEYRGRMNYNVIAFVN